MSLCSELLFKKLIEHELLAPQLDAHTIKKDFEKAPQI